jgi:hypothetical protein
MQNSLKRVMKKMPNLNLKGMADYINKNVLSKVMSDVGKESVKKLRDHVQVDVYNAGSGRKFYHSRKKEPTGDLKRSVVKSRVKVTKDGASVTISHDPEKLRLDQENNIHGSDYKNDRGEPIITDVRESLPHIINDGLSGNRFGNGWWRRKRPYFTNFKVQMNNGEYKRFFLESKIWKDFGITLKG